MSDIYLIPFTVPCPSCGEMQRVATLASVLDVQDYAYCPFCKARHPIKDWLGKYVGMIKDVKDEA